MIQRETWSPCPKVTENRGVEAKKEMAHIFIQQLLHSNRAHHAISWQVL